MAKYKTIDSLQALRGIAAVLVLLFHIGSQPAYLTSQSYFSYISSFGFAGVDLFFVLSGFIIYYTSANNPSLTPYQFFAKRFIRIYPIYWLAMLPVLTAFVILKFYPVLAAAHSGMYESINAGGLKFILVSLCLLPFVAAPIVSVSWTLSYEIFFYLIFGLLYFRSQKLFISALSIWVVICIGITFIFNIDFERVEGYSLIQLLNPLVAEFLYGCIIAIICLKYASRYAAVILGAGVILFCLAGLTTASENHYRELSYGLPAAFIVYGLVNVKVKFPRFLIYLGNASYSLYIFHIPILSAIAKNSAFFTQNYLINTGIAAIIFLLIISICLLIHAYIEKPLYFICQKWLLRGRPSASATIYSEATA